MTSIGEKLSEAAASLETATREAVAWVINPRNRETIQRNRPTLDERDLRRRTIELRRLREAATRPMAAAVFGASQHGKSYMVSVLAGIGSTLHIDLPGMSEPVDYIARINPAGGKESTGLVTRFTVRPSEAPADHPVQLRLLGHADILKILLNGYLHEGDPQVYERDPRTQEVGPSSERIAQHVGQFARGTGASNGLTIDDVWDLAEYVSVDLAKLGFVGRLGPFWEAAATIAPTLGIDQLGRFFSILWGGHEVLTRTYVRLVGALAELGFPRTAYSRFEAIDATEPGRTSILDVAALLGITDEAGVGVSVMSPSGQRATIARPILCAIAAELHLTISRKPWPFFDGTDLLDFPGYRPRGLPEEGRDEKNQPIGGLAHYFSKNLHEYMKELFLRGKVEYLFQRYVAEQEVSAMLLCVKGGNLDVPNLPTVVSQWIEGAQGAEPRDRVGKPVLLLFVLTMFDMHLMETKADAGQGLAVRFNNRLEASLLEKFGRHEQSWVQQWTPGQPFRNCFLMRNPGIQNSGLFAYRDGSEVEILPTQTEWIQRLKTAFLSVEHVQRHFADPSRAFDEVLGLNDGGARHIADYLGSVCDPMVKHRQIAARLEAVRGRLLSDIEPLHIDEDLQKLREQRLQMAQKILDGIEECAFRQKLGSLLRVMMVGAGALSDGLYQASITVEGRGGASDAGAPAAAAAPASPVRRTWSRPGMPAAAASPTERAEPAATSRRETGTRNLDVVARVAMNIWRDRLHQIAADADIPEEFGVPRDALRELCIEVYTAAVRNRLEDRLRDAMERFVFNDKSEERLPKVVLICERLINRFVSHLGFDDLAPEKRPVAPSPDGDRAIFTTPEVAYDASGIGSSPAAYRDAFIGDWMFAFHQAVDDNASSKEGQRIDVEQNELIGRVVTVLRRAQPQEATR